MRYIGGVLSSVEPETTSTSASGVFTLNDYAQKVSATNLPTPKLGIQFLMVGGGGSGGPGQNTPGGGGGAGGVLESLDFSFKITRGVTYTILIGAGGTADDFFSSRGTNTSAFGLVALEVEKEQPGLIIHLLETEALEEVPGSPGTWGSYYSRSTERCW